VEPVAEWTAGAQRDFEAWARRVAALPEVDRVEMETVERDAQIAHTGRAELPRYVALLSVWLDDARTLGPILAAAAEHGVERVIPFEVEQCTVRHDFPRTWADGESTPGLKKSTFWQANPDFGPGWRERYERHAAIVRDHHSSAWQYRQNLLSTHDDPGGWNAVSELWWPTPAGLLEHFYNSPESQRAVWDDTVFVGRAMPIVTAHTILRSVPALDGSGDARSTS
jgi:hypothetical protein